MADTDSILAGVAAATLAFIGLNICVYYLRKRNAPSPTMKLSPSMEELNSVEASDPEV